MKQKYTIPVNFTTTITVDVEADNINDAMSDAELDTCRIFSNLMMEGSLYAADFVSEVQEI